MSHLISCGEAVRLLWEYIDHALEVDDRNAVEGHLALCVRCCGELEFAQELQRLLATRADVALPPEVGARLHAFIDALPDADETESP